MGTNFYCKKKLSSTQLAEIKQLANDEKISDLKRVLDRYIEESEHHIGKRSYGWAFLFQAKGRSINVPWDSLEELKEYLQLPDIDIFNEYGEHFTFDSFWNEEIGNSLYPNEEHWSNKEYYEQHPEEKRPNWDPEFIKDGVRWMKGIFS